jgi:hypothetical protein
VDLDKVRPLEKKPLKALEEGLDHPFLLVRAHLIAIGGFCPLGPDGHPPKVHARCQRIIRGFSGVSKVQVCCMAFRDELVGVLAPAQAHACGAAVAVLPHLYNKKAWFELRRTLRGLVAVVDPAPSAAGIETSTSCERVELEEDACPASPSSPVDHLAWHEWDWLEGEQSVLAAPSFPEVEGGQSVPTSPPLTPPSAPQESPVPTVDASSDFGDMFDGPLGDDELVDFQPSLFF